MTSKLLLARTIGNEFLVAWHLDDSRWVDGSPDPEWVHLQRWPAGVEHAVALQETLTEAVGVIAAKFPDAFPAAFVHRLEGASVQAPVGVEEAGRKGGESGSRSLEEIMSEKDERREPEEEPEEEGPPPEEEEVVRGPGEPWELPGQKDTRPNDGTDRTADGFPSKEDALGARELPKQPGKR